MPEYLEETAIAAGYNVPLVDLDLITSLSADGVNFLPVQTIGKYVRGEKKFKASGAKAYSGFKAKTLASGLMTMAQFDYLVTTYEGPITLYSWLTGTTPVRFNAMLDMGDIDDYEPVNTIEHGWMLKDVLWSLSMIEVL